MTLLIFILILAVLVLVHEFGHFIAAKRAGVKVEEFGFGFPPRIFGVKKGETLYSINLIPLGGFVKLYGEEYIEEEQKEFAQETDPNERQRAFIYKKPFTKSLIILAGVVMNVVLASVLYFSLLSTQGFKSDPIIILGDYSFPFGHATRNVMVAGVSKNSPAEKVGIEGGDVITRVKTSDDQWTAVTSPNMLIQKVAQNDKKELLVETTNIRDGATQSTRVVPAYNKELKRAAIGIGLAEVVTISYTSPLEKVFSGLLHAYNMASYSFSIFGQLIGQSFAEKTLSPVGEAVSGPVGIFYAISDTVRTSGSKVVRNLIDITALLSISLAVVNTLPFPALDGGRFAFILYEWVARRRVNRHVERYINAIGLAVLLTLAVIISINDILKLSVR